MIRHVYYKFTKKLKFKVFFIKVKDGDFFMFCFDIEMELAAAMSVQEESQKRIATGQSMSSEPLVDFVGGAFAELNPFGWSGGVDDED